MKGVVFTNVMLADEINRTPPRTQAALLEAMQERTVTVDGQDAPPARPVPGHRHPEPVRARGHLRAARVAARPLPLQDRPRLLRRRERGRDAAAPAHRASRRTCSARSGRCSASSASTRHGRSSTTPRCPRPWPATSSGSSAARATHRGRRARRELARRDPPAERRQGERPPQRGRDSCPIEDVRDVAPERPAPPPHLQERRHDARRGVAARAGARAAP